VEGGGPRPTHGVREEAQAAGVLRLLLMMREGTSEAVGQYNRKG